MHTKQLKIPKIRNALRYTRCREELHTEGLLKKHGMKLIHTDQDRVKCQVPMIS